VATVLGTPLGTSLRSALGNTLTALEQILALAAGRPVFNETEYLIGGTGAVRAIYDLSDATRTHVLDQADTAKQVAVPVGLDGYNFTGTQSYKSNWPAASYDWAVNGSGASMFCVHKPTVSSATVKTVFAFANVFETIGFYLFSTSLRGYANGAWGDILIGSAATNVRGYFGVIHASARSPQRTFYNSGTGAAYAGAPTPTAGSPLTLGARGDGASPHTGMVSLLILAPEWSASQFAAYQDATNRIYGVAA
jgi:hypothetical protein